MGQDTSLRRASFPSALRTQQLLLHLSAHLLHLGSVLLFRREARHGRDAVPVVGLELCRFVGKEEGAERTQLLSAAEGHLM